MEQSFIPYSYEAWENLLYSLGCRHMLTQVITQFPMYFAFADTPKGQYVFGFDMIYHNLYVEKALEVM